MKVLILSDSLTAGGKERRLVELIKGFRDRSDVKVRLVVFSDRIHYKEVFEQGISVDILKRVPKHNPMVVYRLFKICMEWKPDLIHSWGTMSTMIAIPSSQLLKIKLINANIADAPKDMRFFDKRRFRAKITFPFSNVIVGNSEAGLKAYSVPESKGFCVYNGFDLKRVIKLNAAELIRNQWGIETKYVIGMVAGFASRKDYPTFIQSAIQVMENRDDVSFIAVGDGPELEKCKKMVSSQYLNRFIFTGLRRDVESIVNIFDVGVLATNSNVHGEGISNAILEYMALRKPTIATIGGGTDEVVVSMKTGILVPPQDFQLMAEKIQYLLNNPEVSKDMGAAARHRIEEVFSLTRMTDAYYQLYQKISASID